MTKGGIYYGTALPTDRRQERAGGRALATILSVGSLTESCTHPTEKCIAFYAKNAIHLLRVHIEKAARATI